MLPKNRVNNFIKRTSHYLLVILMMMFAVSAYAAAQSGSSGPTNDLLNLTSGASTITAETVLQRIATQIPQLTSLVTAIAYVMGIYFVVMGVLKLREYGESRTMMSGQRSLQGPMVSIIIGTLLIYIPTTVQVGMATFWTNPNPYGYDTSSQDQWVQFIDICFVIVQFVGVVAFIRGLVILSALGGQSGGHHNAFAKGITHIIGGIFCINIYQTVNVILVTLGLSPY